MDIEVDVIEFKVPLENNKTLFVWDIQPVFTEVYVYESLWSVYSQFGALYLLKVCPNARVAQPGFYAMVKFYSAAQASKAQRATDRRCLFQNSPVKVRLSTKQNLAFFSAKPLSLSKCLDLANHYLGFNGWSSRIITLKDISRCAASAEEASDSQEVLLKYGCIAELSFPQHGLSCKGIGVAEDVLLTDPDPEQKLRARGRLMKWAKDKAVVNAFEKVLLMLLGNGKIAIECKFDPEEILPEEDSEGLIKVNDISWTEFDAANDHIEEEVPWDFTTDH